MNLKPAIIVIFGITGDLSQRYLLPSLYHLIKDGTLHPDSRIFGITRREVTTQALIDKVRLSINKSNTDCDMDALKAMHERTTMVQMDLDDAAAYIQLRHQLDEAEKASGVCMERLLYLSIPPQVYDQVITLLGQANLNGTCAHGQTSSRLLVEKPFGFDYPSAQQLIADTAKVFDESQIFRIDHYLAKEAVQNILTFRAENPLFEALWGSPYISRIDVNAYEKIGIEGRKVFYESLGALRDFIQSHLVQIMALVTMDKPAAFDSDSIHTAKQALLQQVETIPGSEIARRVVRGQYEGYRDEVENQNSTTETFAAITLNIANDRWRNVPITLSTGKALRERKTEISIWFTNPSGHTNQLLLRIQPNEGINLHVTTKQPGYDTATRQSDMDFSYSANPSEKTHPDAYERVIVDAIRGDQTLFASSAEVLESWRILQPVVEAWQQSSEDLIFYAAGSDGPSR